MQVAAIRATCSITVYGFDPWMKVVIVLLRRLLGLMHGILAAELVARPTVPRA